MAEKDETVNKVSPELEMRNKKNVARNVLCVSGYRDDDDDVDENTSQILTFFRPLSMAHKP